jgi:SAM-dependent methyltransferase
VTYEQLVDDALRIPFQGWDFSVLHGRFVDGKPSWDYRAIVSAELPAVSALLDLGTGGGEFLSSLAPLPPTTKATEGYAPNVPIARQRLAALGIEVADLSSDSEQLLPYEDASFDLVLSRHESYAPSEVRRVLRPDGRFITQQVGGRDLEELNQALRGPAHAYRDWDLDTAAEELSDAGFTIVDRREELIPSTFHDIGAVVLMLRITPWHVADFTTEAYEDHLRKLHDQMAAGTPFTVRAHRFFLRAVAA